MKRLLAIASALTILAGAGAASAQSWDNNRHDDHRRGAVHYDHGWHKGGRIDRNDWRRGQRIDYRRYHLQRPARGYEWRRVDNSFVLAAAATGLIAAIALANN